MNEEQIFNLANQDARRLIVPQKGNPTPGQRNILSSNYRIICEYFQRLDNLCTRQDDLLSEMQRKESVYLKYTEVEKDDLIQKKERVSKSRKELNTLNLKIKEQQEIFANANITFPNATANANRSWNDLKEKLRAFWMKIRRVFSRLFIFAVLESFASAMLWDLLRDYKSISDTLLRIIGSAVIFGSIHFSEKKHQGHDTNNRLWYTAYIIFAWISALVLLFGSFVVLAIFPEILDRAWSLEQIYDLNATDTTTVITGNTFLSSYVKYDFLIAMVCLLIYMLISVLDKGKPKAKKDENIKGTADKPNFVQLLTLYTEQEKVVKEIKALDYEIETDVCYPTDDALSIDKSLKELRDMIENLDSDIGKVQLELSTSINSITDILNLYRVSYDAIFNRVDNDIAKKPEWLDKQDIIVYYRNALEETL